MKELEGNENYRELMDLYNGKGFATAELFVQEDLNALTSTFAELLNVQMRKVNLDITGDLQNDISKLNNLSSVALNEVLGMVRNTSAGHKLASNSRLRKYSDLFLSSKEGGDDRKLIISGPSFFVNMPSTNERKYTWHAEQNWYPKRRNFLNVWCPIFDDRVNNDSMAVMAGSHKKDWFYFSEYSGYGGAIDKVITEINKIFSED